MRSPFTEKQRQVWRDTMRETQHRWNFQTGAVSSGKTYIDFFRIPARLAETKGLGLNVFLGNTQATLERNIFEPMREIWGSQSIGTVKGSNEIMLFGHKCYAIGANNKAQVARIQGATVEYAYGDEVGTWAPEVFVMLQSRLRTQNSKFDGTCNPDHPEHWLRKFLDSGADIYEMAYTLDDNTFLPIQYINDLKKEYAGTVYYDRYILGLWRAASGLVYPNFILREEEMLIPFIQPQTLMNAKFYVSLDYGTVNPFAALLWAVTPKQAILVKEFYFDSKKERRQMTDEEYYQELEKLTEGYHIQKVIVDPSAESFMETIRRHRRFRVEDAENSVLDGIRVTASLMGAGLIKFHADAQETRREFRVYSWDEGIIGIDRPLKINDHAPDAVRYFAATILAKEFRWTKWRKEV